MFNKIIEILEYAHEKGASDVLITKDSEPMLRINSEWEKIGEKKLSHNDAEKMILNLVSEDKREQIFIDKEYDFSYSISDELRIRANIYFQKNSISAVFRIISTKVPNIDSLGIPDALKDFALKNNGLILITGSAGSGKTTTIAGIIDFINKTKSSHIITVEDPIEYIQKNNKGIIDQREIGNDTNSFAKALKYVLRQAPDVIVVGEMRDIETMQAAITAAETGHLVIATLHTNDAIQAIDRIIDVFPGHQQNQIRMQLAATLLGVFAQQLIPQRNAAKRILATETLIVNNAVAASIRNGKMHMIKSLMEAGQKFGNATMDKSLKLLFDAGKISYDEVVLRVSDQKYLQYIKKDRKYFIDEKGNAVRANPLVIPKS